MPQMRNKTVRRLVSKINTTDDATKLRMLRTLYMIVYNSEKSLIMQSVELFHLLGDILEGVPAANLQFHCVDKDLFLRELSDF
jgi:hypothetical protein